MHLNVGLAHRWDGRVERCRVERCRVSPLSRKPKTRVFRHKLAQFEGRASGDQVIRENPASRGTDASAEVLVGPPWRMVPNAGQQQCYGGYPCMYLLQAAAQARSHSARSTVPPPPPHPSRPLSLQSASEGIGGARGLGNLVRPESHPEPRGFPVQWADPGIKPERLPVIMRSERY